MGGIIIIKKIFLFVLLFIIVVPNAFAIDTDDVDYYQQNPDTGYAVVIDDEANLLKDEEIGKLSDEMFSLTKYGNIVFLTKDNSSLSSQKIAHDYYYNLFNTDSGTVILINMRERVVYIHSDGENYKSITDDKALSITNNIYRELKNKNYYVGAKKAFSQIQRILMRTIYNRRANAAYSKRFSVIFN